MAGPFLQGFQVGAGLAGDVMDRNARLQEARSRDALRRVQEQAAVQQLQLTMEQNNLAIQERADMAKAVSAARAATQETIQVPGLDGEGTFEIPNPSPLSQEEAAFRHVLPVVAQYRPDRVPNVIESIAMAKYRQGHTPTSRSVTMPDGRTIQGVMTSPNQFTPVVDPTIEQVTDPTTGAVRPILRTGLTGAKSLPADVAQRQQEAFRRTQMADQLSFIQKNAPKVYADLFASAPIDPETAMPQVTPEAIAAAAKNAGFQGGTQSQMEGQDIGAENVIEVGRRFLPLINSKTVGPTGWWKREVVAKVPGVDVIFGTEGVSDAVAAETVGKQFLGHIFKTLRSDSNINQAEYTQIVQAAPDPTRFLTKPEGEKRKLYEFLVNAATVSRNNAIRRGRQITPMFLTRSEILGQIQSGQITEDQGIQIWNNSATALMQDLRTQF